MAISDISFLLPSPNPNTGTETNANRNADLRNSATNSIWGIRICEDIAVFVCVVFVCEADGDYECALEGTG